MLFETKPVNVKFQRFFYHFEKSGQQHWSVYLSQDENINFRHYLLFQTELNDLIDYFTTNHRNFCKLQLLVYHCTFSQFAKQVSSESILGVSGYWLSNPKEKEAKKFTTYVVWPEIFQQESSGFWHERVNCCTFFCFLG